MRGAGGRSRSGPGSGWIPRTATSPSGSAEPRLVEVLAPGTLTRGQLAERVGASRWGPGRFGTALRQAVARGTVVEIARNRYARGVPPPGGGPGR